MNRTREELRGRLLVTVTGRTPLPECSMSPAEEFLVQYVHLVRELIALYRRAHTDNERCVLPHFICKLRELSSLTDLAALVLSNPAPLMEEVK